MKILIVEDSLLLGKSMKQGLEERGWVVDWAPDGAEGIYFAESSTYDVIVLDWMLPNYSGMEILKDLRKKSCFVPVIMITAKSAVAERIRGLDSGADDYLVKPFEMGELIARIQSLYRRSQGRGTATVKIGKLSMDLAGQRVFVADESLDLTGKEYDLLAALVTKPGELVKRQALIGLLYQLDGEPDSNSLDVLLARVRKKITGSQVEIATIRGKGFVLRVASPST